MKMCILRKFVVVALCCVPSLLLAQTSPYTRTTIVSPDVGANSVDNGTKLLNAIAGITSASATDPWLLKIEPGTYDLGSSRLQMKSWVDVEGSGIRPTTIKGAGPSGSNDAIVLGASNSEIRGVTIKCENTAGCRGIFNSGSGSDIGNVKIESLDGTGSKTGIRNEDSNVTIENVSIKLRNGTGDLYGIVNADNASYSYPTILKTDISIFNLADGATGAGIKNEGQSRIWKMLDSQIVVVGGGTNDTAAGVLRVGGSAILSGRTQQAFTNVTIFVKSAQLSNKGIDVNDSDIGIYLERSYVTAEGAGSQGVYAPKSTVIVTNSEVGGELNTIDALHSQVGISRLNGGDLKTQPGGSASCGLVVDEVMFHFQNSCP